MIGHLLGALALIVIIALAFHVPALYPAALALEHAFTGFLRALVNGA